MAPSSHLPAQLFRIEANKRRLPIFLRSTSSTVAHVTQYPEDVMYLMQIWTGQRKRERSIEIDGMIVIRCAWRVCTWTTSGSNEETLNKRMSSISSRYNLKALYILSISRELVGSAHTHRTWFMILYIKGDVPGIQDELGRWWQIPIAFALFVPRKRNKKSSHRRYCKEASRATRQSDE